MTSSRVRWITWSYINFADERCGAERAAEGDSRRAPVGMLNGGQINPVLRSLTDAAGRRLSARYERTFMAHSALHVSQIRWRTTVAHLPTEDSCGRPLSSLT